MKEKMFVLLLFLFVSLHSTSTIIESQLQPVTKKTKVISAQKPFKIKGLAVQYIRALRAQKAHVSCCAVIYMSEQGFRKHFQDCHTEVLFKCHKCNAIMTYKINPERHGCRERRVNNLEVIVSEMPVDEQNTAEEKMNLKYILN